MEIFSALLALCAGNSQVTSELSSQRGVTRSFGVFFDLCLNKLLSTQSKHRWFEIPSHPLWRHCNGMQYDTWNFVSNEYLYNFYYVLFMWICVHIQSQKLKEHDLESYCFATNQWLDCEQIQAHNFDGVQGILLLYRVATWASIH